MRIPQDLQDTAGLKNIMVRKNGQEMVVTTNGGTQGGTIRPRKQEQMATWEKGWAESLAELKIKVDIL